jgi:hypothetical protein
METGAPLREQDRVSKSRVCCLSSQGIAESMIYVVHNELINSLVDEGSRRQRQAVVGQADCLEEPNTNNLKGGRPHPHH